MIKKIFIGTVTALSLFAGTANASSIDLPPQAMNELAGFLCNATQKGYSRDYIYDQMHYQLKTYYQNTGSEMSTSPNNSYLTNETARLFNEMDAQTYKRHRHEAINEIVDHANQNKCQFN